MMKEKLKGLFHRQPKQYKAISLSEITWQKFKREKMGMISLAFIILVAIVALLGYLITPDQTPYCNAQHLEIALRKPGFKVQMLYEKQPQDIEKRGPLQKMLFGQPAQYRTIPIDSYKVTGDTMTVVLFEQDAAIGTESYALSELRPEQPVATQKFLLGTDRYGRDVLSQLMMGSRISLAVGFISVFIALIIGILVGATAGYFRGWIDDVLMWFINVVWSIPTLLLVIAIGLTMWVDVARVVRGQVISLREQEFVEAGKALGYNSFHIILKHILPNVVGTLIVIAASNFSSAIMLEAGLSFLGLGVQPPTPSWGIMLKENYAYIVLDKAYLAIVPGIAIMLLVLAFMLIGSALRNAMDVKN